MNMINITQKEYDKLAEDNALNVNTMYVIEPDNTSNILMYDTGTYSWKSEPVTYEDKPKIKSATYVCPYCGTHYIADTAGFIPNCKNCGATMEKEEPKDTSYYPRW